MTFGGEAVINTPPNIRKMAAAIYESGAKPEMELFDSGDVNLARDLIAEGVIKTPAMACLVLGIKYGFAASAETMLVVGIFAILSWNFMFPDITDIRVLTPLDDRHAGGIALVQVDGIDTPALQGWLWSKHRIITTPIVHPEFHGLRITPNVYTMLDEVDRFSDAVLQAVRHGVA